jgi:hypothetical protein
MAVHASAVRSAFWALLPALFFFAVLLFFPNLLAQIAPRIHDAYYRQALGAVLGQFGMAYFAYFGVVAALVVYAMLERHTALPRKLALTGLLAVAGLSTFVVPAVGELQAPIREAARLARERHFDVVMWRLNAPSFSVYRGAPTPSREPRAGDIIVTRASRLAELPKGTAYDILFSRGGIVLARIKA